jgi:hypothetical protein
MKNIKKNKKAFIASWTVDFYAYLIAVLVVIVFFIIFKVTAGEITSAITGKAEELDGEITLLNLLRTPITVGNTDLTMADLIVMRNTEKAENREHYTNLIKQTIEETLDELEYCHIMKKKGYREGIYKRGFMIFLANSPTAPPPTEAKRFSSENYVYISTMAKRASIQQIPLPNNEKVYALFYYSDTIAKKPEDCKD